MYPFVETIKCIDNQFFLIDLHQKRLNATFNRYFPDDIPHELSTLIKKIDYPFKKKTLYKCRFLYGSEQFDFECTPYIPKNYTNFKFIDTNGFRYDFKSTDRLFFHKAQKLVGANTLPIFVHNRKILDTTIHNLCFWDGGAWHTPKSFLLNGVQRQSLLKKRLILEKEITLSDLGNYTHFSCINALISWGDTKKIPIGNLYLTSI